MIFPFSNLQIRILTVTRHSWRRISANCFLIMVAVWSCFLLLGTPSALAGFNDDSFDGNVFVLYAGNGSLVPPRVTLKDSFQRHKPALLVFYVDDSRDCKQYAIVVSRIQEYYGKAADIIPVNVDAIPQKSTYTSAEPGYYYEGVVPQTVLLNQSGEVVLNTKGKVPYEQVDDVLREVFNLLPRSKSLELRRRTVNEFNTELTQ